VAGIEAVGWSVPRWRITADEYRKATGGFAARGVEEKTVLGPDEDEVTLAVEAGTRALEAGQASGEALAALAIVSRTSVAPAPVAEALGARSSRVKVSAGGDPGPALLGVLDQVAAEGGHALCIAVGVPTLAPPDPAEAGEGAGAVGLLCGAGGLARVQAAHAGGESEGPERLVVEAVGRAGPGPHDLILGSAPGAKGIAPAQLAPFLGSWGAAAAFVPVAEQAGKLTAGQRVLVVSASAHSATAITFVAAGPVPSGRSLLSDLKRRQYLPYPLHLRRSLATSGREPSQGAYVSPTAYLTEAKARYRLVGESCRRCGTLHFPPRETCRECGGRDFTDRALRRTGTVYSATAIGRGAAPSEFAEQQAIWGEYATAIVALDDGPHVTAMLTDIDPGDARIGMAVEMVFRRLYIQEDAPRYGFKFRPRP
jgi:uncharacterized OB-fold protein